MSKLSPYDEVRIVVQMKLGKRLEEGGPLPSPEDIRREIEKVKVLFEHPLVETDRMVADLERSFQTVIGRERTLSGDDETYVPWLEKRKPSIDWRFWGRYEQYLIRQGWPAPTLSRLDEMTDRVLGLLNAPDQKGSWDRRGMIVGHVQSGKTSNYIGLICKAVDAGYRLVIVLSGFHKSLRSQTQIRLEEGFLGYFLDLPAPGAGTRAQRIGVGLIDPDPLANCITSRADNGDFKRQVASSFAIRPGNDALLFVIKKNASVLQNLLNWVEYAANQTDEKGMPYVSGIPVLVIDDEADQGSIDTRSGAFDEDGDPDPDHDPTILNQRIRQLLLRFDQSAYVAYTATPFANIFIHERARTDRCGEDLFPRSFIVSLPAPSNYVGTSAIFGRILDDGTEVPGIPIIRHVADHAGSLEPRETAGWMPPVHDKHHEPLYQDTRQLPPSLRQAIQAFILVCAARQARGQTTQHSSMLIHVTRFNAVQAAVVDQVREYLAPINRRLRYGDGGGSPSILDELHRLWEEDFVPTTQATRVPDCPPVSWDAILPHLAAAASSIQIRSINGQAGEVLDYEKYRETGLNIIAIGGDKLSRGLTLEGLSVSYFLRASKMYDTLMQMGRWFGYRPGFLDLCRLYTTPELTEWFGHIASASEELREDLDRMASSGGTPRDFGHRVRSHPTLLVTSQVKMRHSEEIVFSYDGDISETINFWRDCRSLERNWNSALSLVRAIEAMGTQGTIRSRNGGETGSVLWSRVDPEHILAFLEDYREHPEARRVKTSLLADYIRQENQQGRLVTWTVLLASGSSPHTVTIGAATVPLVVRSWHLPAGNEQTKRTAREDLRARNQFRIRRLLDPVDEAVDLDEETRELALQLTITDWEREDDPVRKRPTRAGGPRIRELRHATHGLLLLYPITGADHGDDIHEAGKVDPDVHPLPVLGFGISFPGVRGGRASRVSYKVNNIYWEQEVGSTDPFEIEDDGLES